MSEIPYSDQLWDFAPVGPTGATGPSVRGEYRLRILSSEEELYSLPSSPTPEGLTVMLPLGEAAPRTGPRPRTPQPPSADQARQLGRRLWDALPPAATDLLRAAADVSRPLRIKISSSAPPVTDLPWEWLSDGADPPVALRPGVRLARCVPARFRTPPLTVQRPLRVLVVLTNPKDERLLQPQPEIDAISGRLKPPDYDLSVCAEADVNGLRHLLQRAPHVIHYIGHAGIDHAEGNLILHDDRDRSYWMSGGEMAQMLPSSVRLLCLSTCFTAPNYQVQGLARFAHAPAEFALPTMVANQYDLVHAATARTFWSVFYDALIRHGGNVNEAVQDARKATAAACPPPDWAGFTLVLRDQTGRPLRLDKPRGGDLAKQHALEYQAQYAARLANELAGQVRLFGEAAPPELHRQLEQESRQADEMTKRLTDPPAGGGGAEP